MVNDSESDNGRSSPNFLESLASFKGRLPVDIIVVFSTELVESLAYTFLSIPLSIIVPLALLTLVYVQITLLLLYFTLEITLGSKKNYTFFSVITNCQT